MPISGNDRKVVTKICNIIKKHKNFLLTTHQVPDGDGLGCELAFLRILKRLGKNVFIINEVASSQVYSFLPGYSEVQVAAMYKGEKINADVTIVFDCSAKQRIGRILSFVGETKIINIDHHYGNTFFGDINWVSETRSSVGEMCFFIAKHLDCLDKGIAECFYVSILTDTGSFKHNFNVETISVVAELLKVGIDPEKIADNVYHNNSIAALNLLGHALVNLQYAPDLRTAWTVLRKCTFEKTKATEQDSELVIDMLQTVEKTDFVFLVRERNNEIKFSLRSRKSFNVRKIAEHFGGGGHDSASGFSIKNASINSALEKFFRYLKERS
ncbi:MAG: bifunctional oligoribonuclease/PAP phosphatase NrnA [bacterium]|nr:bifunctional oligoribonuclease/PAP phosphatase NrnA [bacterium]